jgi:pimeloyl-ACP methyl ester carboxylesterase
MLRSTISVIALAGVTTAAYHCESFFVPVTITAPSFQLAFPEFRNHYDSVLFVNELTARNASEAPSPIAGIVNITETFSISAKYCSPARRSGHSDVQVLSHGLGFDKSYWDFLGPESEYNYIKVATEYGYSTLSYDRLGNGLSEIVDPYSIQQAPIELAILAELTKKLRAGSLASCVPKAKGKVLHVGHSFGSDLSNALAAAYPTLSDGVAMTGYSAQALGFYGFATASLFHLAKENQPARFGDRSTGSLSGGPF